MPDTYHHGDLRRALLDEAATVLTESGVGALSLRELARRVGVSATAPYHHFPNKAALVSALAEDALWALDEALIEAVADVADPEARLRALGVAYVLFAVEHPEKFRLAFRPEMGSPAKTLTEEDEDLPTRAPAFRHLWSAVVALEINEQDRSQAALAAWGLVHGLASLLVDGPLRPLSSERRRVQALAEAATARLSLRPSSTGDEAP